MHNTPFPTTSRGFTLAELVVVLVIVAAVAGVALVSAGGAASDAQAQATASTLASLRAAVVDGYLADVAAMPASTADVLRRPASVAAFDPLTRAGWRGPYARCATVAYAANAPRNLLADYGTDGDPFPVDGWGNPVVLQVPNADGAGPFTADELRHARLVSPGPDGVLDTPRTDAAAAPGTALFPSRATCGDDVVTYLRVADGKPE